MATVDSYNNVFEVLAIPPQSGVAGTSGPAGGVDTAGFESVNFVIAYGSVGATAEWFHTLLDSDDGTVFTPVVNTADVVNLLGSQTGPTGSQDDSVYRLGYVGPKRYVKLDMDTVGSSTTLFSGVCELGNPHDCPTPPNE